MVSQRLPLDISARYAPFIHCDVCCVQGCGVLPEHMDVVLAALWQHFRQRQRWHAADAFFRQLAQVYSPAALLVAATARAEGIGSTRAIGYLLSDLLLHSDHDHDQLPPASLVGLGAELLQSGQPAQAADLARQALQLNHRCRPAWLLLAQCFIAQRQYAAALVALNVVPTPPLPAAEVELLHVVPPPQPKNTTQPMVSMSLKQGAWQQALYTTLLRHLAAVNQGFVYPDAADISNLACNSKRCCKPTTLRPLLSPGHGVLRQPTLSTSSSPCVPPASFRLACMMVSLRA